jgi:hypothetical protein
MANTTNYNWETPDDTDLVKDGAAAIRTLGNSVDTTTKALNPETTLGDIAYRSATSNTNTRLAIGSAGQVLTVAAGVPSWASPSDQTPLTTKGDLFTFTTVDARLGVGANGTVLTADSTEATGLKWVAPAASTSGFTFITSASPSASAATNVNSCFTSTYDHYRIMYYLTATTTSNNRLALRMRASGSDLTSNYKNAGSYTNGADGAIGFNDLETSYIMIGQNDTGNPNMAYGVIDILRPQASDYTRLVINSSGFNGTTQYSYEFRTFVNNTTSYDGFTIYVPSGNVTGNFKVYGYSNS